MVSLKVLTSAAFLFKNVVAILPMMAYLGGNNMFISSLFLLAVAPISLAEQLPSPIQLAPPATFTDTFTPIPIDRATTAFPKQTASPATFHNTFTPVPIESARAQSTVRIDGPVQTVVGFPLGGARAYGPQGYEGSVLGSIVGVDATATTFELKCNTNAFGCDNQFHPMTITQGPSTFSYAYTVLTSGYAASYTKNCTSIAPSSFSCLQIYSVSMNLPTETTSFNITTTNLYTRSREIMATGEPILDDTDDDMDDGTVLYVPIPITAGTEKILAFQASKTSSSVANQGTNTPSKATDKSGAVGLRRDLWVFTLVIIAILSAIL